MGGEGEEIVIEITPTPLRLLAIALAVAAAVAGYQLHRWYEESRPVIQVRVLTPSPRVGDLLVFEVARLKGEGDVAVQLLGGNSTLIHESVRLAEGEARKLACQVAGPGIYRISALAEGRVYASEVGVEG